jgi:hypothetical protein
MRRRVRLMLPRDVRELRVDEDSSRPNAQQARAKFGIGRLADQRPRGRRERSMNGARPL